MLEGKGAKNEYVSVWVVMRGIRTTSRGLIIAQIYDDGQLFEQFELLICCGRERF